MFVTLELSVQDPVTPLVGVSERLSRGWGVRGGIMVGVHVRASVVGVLILSQEGEREKGMCEWVNGAGRTGWDSTVPSKAYP